MMKYFDEDLVKPEHYEIIKQMDNHWIKQEHDNKVQFISITDVKDTSSMDPVVVSYIVDKLPTYII